VKDDQQSRLASMNASMQGLGAALGPVILASLYQLGQLIPFFALMIGLVSMLVVFLYCKTKSGHAF